MQKPRIGFSKAPGGVSEAMPKDREAGFELPKHSTPRTRGDQSTRRPSVSLDSRKYGCFGTVVAASTFFFIAFPTLLIKINIEAKI